MSNRHAYCQRCQRSFDSLSAKRQHVLASSRHHICPECPQELDFDTDDDLDHHLKTIHHCCTECQRLFNSASQLTQHDISQHNMCDICERCFENPTNLRNHRRSHEAKNVICFGCSKKFRSSSAMLLHLETGYCESGVDEEEVTSLALQCYHSKHYTCYDDEYDFKCPTCDTPFAAISGLFQHVESHACNEDLTEQSSLVKFLRFLYTQI
ncbi:hypothetical protein VTK73DRAFT_307 [Phialemonium thermophilum]|uniref:C2H2-type domain-containing protein n=1 Tax=Phialemonium thermophilum TaxID=223376 RepID=A0ABR3XF70_9PEZI